MVLKGRVFSWAMQPLFWIILFGIIRLYGIANPPLEHGHNWRQVTGLMVARNFLEVDANILYPRVDLEGGEDRIIGMEFPLLNYLHYILSLAFGYEHWYGRFINLVISSLGLFFFSKLIEQLFNKKMALFASLALLFSIYFSYSRKMMPDTFSISLGIIACYFAYHYFQDAKRKNLLLYFLTASLAILSKIPSIVVLSPLVLLLFTKQKEIEMKIRFSAISAISLLIGGWWYLLWNPLLEKNFGSWYNIGMDWKEGALEILNNLSASLNHISFHSFYSYGFFILFILGLVYALLKKEKTLVWILMVYGTTSLFYIIKSGFYFHHHNYYIIPLVPAMALLVGYFIDQIKRVELQFIILAIAIVEVVSNQQHDFRIKKDQMYKLRAERIMNELGSAEKKLIVLSEGNPQLLYLSHRKGWIRSEAMIKNQEELNNLKRLGANYILIDKKQSELALDAKLAYSDEDFLVYEL